MLYNQVLWFLFPILVHSPHSVCHSTGSCHVLYIGLHLPLLSVQYHSFFLFRYFINLNVVVKFY